MNQFRPSTFKVLPDIVKNLLIINGLFFLATITIDNVFNFDITKLLGLYPIGSANFNMYQYATYIFMHATMGHIISNMFSLWMFGSTIENYWGPKKFLIYYLVTGIGAGVLFSFYTYYNTSQLLASVEMLQNGATPDLFRAFVSEHVSGTYGSIRESFYEQWMNNPDEIYYKDQAVAFAQQVVNRRLEQPTIGASGSVFGILLAFGMLFPNMELRLYFLVPIKAKYFVIAYGAFELYNGVSNNPGDNIAHFAHLGGMLIGFLLIKYWDSNRDQNQFN
ncbi:MAG: rhomboid family intramembrane serine protease [Flavobacteriales bacterium]|nr:rhomboid family intramembrane serine protease [Flavobacteriales bacterium]